MPLPIHTIRNAATQEEIDYTLVLGCLRNEYAAPRDVITRLLHRGDLIRIKKGLYVFGKNYARRPYSLEVLANKIYGPSYLSCEYALSFYGVIPEAVFEITSMTTGRNKIFSTPVGRFSYRYVNPKQYAVGMTYIKLTSEYGALMATPEKAIADLLVTRGEKMQDMHELEEIIYDNYRMDPEKIAGLGIGQMQEIAQIYQLATIEMLPNLIRKAKKNV